MAYFDDDGNELFPDLIPTPSLCIVCTKRNLPNEEILCNLNRLDQKDEKEFVCYAFSSITGDDTDEDQDLMA